MPELLMEEKAVVNPNLYSLDYFLTDNEGCREYLKGLEANTHPKFAAALKIANPTKGDVVLDIGCGRGELLYYCAQRGAKALGIDYSKAAVKIANETIEKLPEHIKHYAQAKEAEIASYNFSEKYSIIFMIEIIEHLYDWQLAAAFKKIKEILQPDGRLIIMTPNYYYEKYLCPIKRIIDMPLNLFKWPFRILRGKYKPNNFRELLHKIFKVKVDRGELNKKMHVNVLTPTKLKKLLHDFDLQIKCYDHSKNIISLITQKWWGRDIVVIARLKNAIKPKTF